MVDDMIHVHCSNMNAYHLEALEGYVKQEHDFTSQLYTRCDWASPTKTHEDKVQLSMLFDGGYNRGIDTSIIFLIHNHSLNKDRHGHNQFYHLCALGRHEGFANSLARVSLNTLFLCVVNENSGESTMLTKDAGNLGNLEQKIHHQTYIVTNPLHLFGVWFLIQTLLLSYIHLNMYYGNQR